MATSEQVPPATDAGTSNLGELFLPVVGISVLVTSVWLYFRWRKFSEKRAEKLAEQEAEALQLKPRVFSIEE